MDPSEPKNVANYLIVTCSWEKCNAYIKQVSNLEFSQVDVTRTVQLPTIKWSIYNPVQQQFTVNKCHRRMKVEKWLLGRQQNHNLGTKNIHSTDGEGRKNEMKKVRIRYHETCREKSKWSKSRKFCFHLSACFNFPCT